MAAKKRNTTKRKAAPKRKATKRRNAPATRKRTIRKTAKRNGSSRRRNSDDEQAARDMFERFHGKPAERVEILDITEMYREFVAECGRLISLDVKVNGSKGPEMMELTDFGTCDVCVTPDGGQLYFTEGDQSLDLEAMGLGDQLPKDHVEVGKVHVITYHTKKGFHDFQPIDYFHKFGEDGGTRPTLNYDVINERLYLSGGSYQVRPEGIVN